MWTSLARAGGGLAVLAFMMWLLRVLLDKIIEVAMMGPHASTPEAQRIGGYFSALTLDNLTLLAGLAVGVFLLSQAAVKKRLSG